MSEPSSSSSGPGRTGYLDDTPNFTPRSLDLISKIQERQWRRMTAVENRGDQNRRPGDKHRSGRRGRTHNDDDDDNDNDDDDDDEVSSIGPDKTRSDLSYTDSQWSGEDEEEGGYDEEQQWREAMDQFELIVRVVVCPLVGKYFGRQWAIWAFSRYQNHGGLSMRFFGLNWVPETIVPSWLAIFSLSAGGS